MYLQIILGLLCTIPVMGMLPVGPLVQAAAHIASNIGSRPSSPRPGSRLASRPSSPAGNYSVPLMPPPPPPGSPYATPSAPLYPPPISPFPSYVPTAPVPFEEISQLANGSQLITQLADAQRMLNEQITASQQQIEQRAAALVTTIQTQATQAQTIVQERVAQARQEIAELQQQATQLATQAEEYARAIATAHDFINTAQNRLMALLYLKTLYHMAQDGWHCKEYKKIAIPLIRNWMINTVGSYFIYKNSQKVQLHASMTLLSQLVAIGAGVMARKIITRYRVQKDSTKL